jgi:riboflavin kinase/FMN adenylyltransferase
VVGENFRFGRGRAGDAQSLKQLGESLGFEAHAAALSSDGEGVISSTRIRELVGAGAVAEAERLLGRPHSLTGVVRTGQGRARLLGVPSANLSDIAEVLPAHGVYAVLVDVQSADGFERLGPGVANIGTRPTLERDGAPGVEVHVLGFDGDLYGKRLRAHLVQRLRDEKRFDGEAALRARLELDKAEADAALREREPDPLAGRAWH